jgi:7-cyano-7-deazaguanine synthase
MRIHTVIYSGGMDSLTLLTEVHDEFMQKGDKLIVVSFNYGQRHAVELNYARAHVRRMGYDWRMVDMGFLAQLLPGSSQTDSKVEVPEGAYDAPNMALTVVPGRNSIMLSLALGITEAAINEWQRRPADLPDEHHAHGIIYFGAHAGDHHIYPDCRASYVAALNRAFLQATDNRVELQAPFQTYTKGDIVVEGLKLGVDYAESWTCYKGGAAPCGKCGSCDERADAFKQAGVRDPLLTQFGLA